MPRCPWTPLLVASLCSLLSNTAFAQLGGVEQGKRLHPVAATAATGRWLERAPFDAGSYGKVRGISPAASRETKIVLSTHTLSEDFFKIAVAVDKYIADKPELAWSFVQVEDKKGAQYGGYTERELRARLAEIKALVEKHGINHLSFVVAAPGSNSDQADPTVVLAHVRPATETVGKPSRFPLVDWVAKKPATELQGDALSKQLMELDTLIKTKR